jgi:alpha(1,3/1,4) fucosyltransferase
MIFSIITVNRNNAFGLEKTIQSVVCQTFENYEYIIIDGNSTDKSTEVLKKNSSHINYWISEPDTGIYNAMNKGIRRAQGDYCLFLNSGDFLCSPTTLQDVFNEINNIAPADIFFSNCLKTDGTVNNFPNNLSINYLIQDPISHQNSLIKRSLFFEHGFFNEELIIASDWEFFLNELWNYKSIFYHIKTNISIFDINGIGSKNTSERLAENLTIIQNVFNGLADIIIDYNYYKTSAYHDNIEAQEKTKLLLFLLKLYKFIFFKSKKIVKLFLNIFIFRLIKILFISIVEILLYFSEMLISIFDKRKRICFTNFKDIPNDFFIIPLSNILKSSHHSYKIVNHYNPHIHFFSVFGNINKIKRSKANCKIFFSGENVNDKVIHNGKYKGNCIDNVSLSFGFDYLKAKNYLRFPLWLLYFFKPDDSEDKIRNTLYKFKKHYQKAKFCSLIASHDRSGIRTKIYNEISKIAPVDCPGFFLHNDNTLHKQYVDNKAVYLQLYKFNICPENSISPGYVTEKLFQSLYSGCIPIYNGWSKNPEPDILNPNIILWYDESNATSLINEVKRLYSDDRSYRSFMEQPFFCDTAVDKIYILLQQFTNKINYNVKNIL